MKQFKTGQTYSAKSVCDNDCVFTFKIVRRTAKSVWIVGGMVKEITRKVIKRCDGHEYILPLGTYSMAPIIIA